MDGAAIREAVQRAQWELAHRHAPVAHTPTDAARAHEALLRHQDLQFDFVALHMPKPPEWLLSLQSWIAKIQPYALWGLGGLALALFLFFLGRHLWRLREAGQATPPQDIRSAMAAWRPTEAQATALLADADALAREGHYGEAVHILLLRSIADLDQFRPRTVQRAYTAREIESLGIMPFALRQSFAGIMQVVEKSLFGGLSVGEAEFARCRAEYERFAFPESWQGG